MCLSRLLLFGFVMNDITSFQGEYRWLSNFWPAKVELDGMIFNSVEHAYVAAKTLDMEVRKQIQNIERPGEVKKLGRSIPLRSDWEEIKLQVMENLLCQKFLGHSDLKRSLLGTGKYNIIEGNTWNDIFWGVCKGRGENHLGKLIMKIRSEIM